MIAMEMDMDDKERRGAVRAHVMVDVKIVGEQRTIQATSLDLSPSGISVWADDGHAPQGTLELSFDLEGTSLSAKGRLARSFQSDGGAVWGIEFADLDAGTKYQLNSFLDRQ